MNLVVMLDVEIDLSGLNIVFVIIIHWHIDVKVIGAQLFYLTERPIEFAIIIFSESVTNSAGVSLKRAEQVWPTDYFYPDARNYSVDRLLLASLMWLAIPLRVDACFLTLVRFNASKTFLRQLIDRL